MPQISVDYSAHLAGSFDRQAFGLALNALTVKTIAATPEACKTRFRQVEESVVGERVAPHALVFVEFQIFPGRSAEAKAELSEAVLALVAEHLAPAPGEPLHAAVNVVDIDRGSYRGVTLAG
ncbi:5-carboxymethyl-2-hydroxymuconate Delta-isomerase [Kitasatospora sp. NPDC050543]|uniref:5-carboxymethyl-2-hydroxymuconate Delta-isomerase n=1 Tax=Kitasatospora sp. NPDC050543 TaxID=3364054 RepID=UPI0037BB7FD3